MRLGLLTIFLVLSVSILSGCGKPSDGSTSTESGSNNLCADVYTFGLAIQLTVPSGTNLSQVQVTVTDGSYQEVHSGSDGQDVNGVLEISAAGERPGTYSVTVTAPSLQTAITPNVTVTGNQCGVATQSLQMTLSP